ncbi:hypothetical protein ACWC2K_09840 [Streptomyces chattanoogensis]
MNAVRRVRGGPAVWARDLAMGMRFAAGGGREGWIRTALTALGVALGVAVLLLGASVPSLTSAWHGREKARENLGQRHEPRPADHTLLYASADTVYRGAQIRGRLVRPDGAHPPVPPGIRQLPGPGRMLVSPALKELLESRGSCCATGCPTAWPVSSPTRGCSARRNSPISPGRPRCARAPATASTTSARPGNRRRCGRPWCCW